MKLLQTLKNTIRDLFIDFFGVQEPVKGFSYYSPLIEAKLNSILESEGVSLFQDVRYGHKKEYIGFPTAEFFKKASGGKTQSTHDNERQWEYTLLLVYEFKGDKTHEEVEALMDITVDKVILSFDRDKDLLGSCMSLDIVPVQFYDILLEEPFIFAEFTIIIKDFVQNYE